MSINDTISHARTDSTSGLTTEDAAIRLEQRGPNELPRPKTFWSQLRTILSPLFNWLIVIYLIGAIILYVVSITQVDPNMSLIYTTLAIVGMNCAVAIFQQLRANKKLKALQDLSAPNSTVIRGGEAVSIPSCNLVVGDILALDTGDRVPADARLLSVNDLNVNEASLTGESESVSKTLKVFSQDQRLSIAERTNMVFFGTFVTNGNARAVVVYTGGDTEMGKISKGLEETRHGDIPIQKKMNKFGKLLGVIILFFWILSSIVIRVTTGHLDLAKSLNSAMDLMPINIPLLSVIVLITGVLSMAQHGVIVRNLAAVESLGRVSVVCSDKTGTLTQSQMSVENIWVHDKDFLVTGNGYEPTGDLFLRVWNDQLVQVEDFSEYRELSLLILAGLLNNNASLIRSTHTTGKRESERWEIIGNPTEGALVTLYHKFFASQIPEFETIREFPFDSVHKRMSKIIKARIGHTCYMKGATEYLLDLCASISVDGNARPLTQKHRQEINMKVAEYAANGLRILSFAYKPIEMIPIGTSLEDWKREQVESDMIYLGFVTILDPPREGVIDAVNRCHDAGVEVIMITGDSPLTAKSIAQKINILEFRSDIVLEGKNLNKVEAFEDFDNVKVFARVSPEDKQVIVQRYQDNNQLVAMTGDGVNDALALSLADAGLAMGIQGTDIAKEAADMVIVDDSFNSIVHGIHRGRSIFANIRSMVFFFIAINIFEGIIQFALAVVLNQPYFLNTEFNYMWIWLSITVHMFPGLMLTFDSVSKDVMKEKPRDSEDILSRKVVGLMVAYGLLFMAAMLIVYYLVYSGTYGVSPWNIIGGRLESLYLYSDTSLFDPELYTEVAFDFISDMDIGELRLTGKTLTMLMTVLYFSECLLALQIRRPNKSLWKSIKQDATKRNYIIIGALFGIYLGMMYIPGLQVGLARLGFNFMLMPLTIVDWLVCAAISMLPIMGFEGIKWLARKRGIIF